MEQQYKYYAFISYNSHDQEWGKRLQRKLEHYRMPSTLCSEHGWDRRPIKPVFFAPTDIQPGGLTEELQERLRSSRNIIVICSPHSAQSEWVGKEIEYFHSLGRTKNIHFFIVDGHPHSGDQQTECFNPAVERLGLPEILGANIHERIYRWSLLNRERAYVQLISKLLGVEFDAIWRRHRKILVQKAIAWMLGTIAVATALVIAWQSNQPFDMEVRLTEVSQRNDNLPPLQNAVVTIALDNETKTDTVRSLDSPVTFTNIPHRCQNQPVHISVSCPNYITVDTIMQAEKRISVGMSRNPSVFGDFRFRLWNQDKGKTYPWSEVTVAMHRVVADDSGYFSIVLPLEEQREWYHVTGTNPNVDDSIHALCGPDAVLIVKY